MKTFFAVIIITLFASAAIAQTDMNRVPYPLLNAGVVIQEFGPTSAHTTKLTVNNTAISLSGYIMYGLVIPASLTTCQIRLNATLPASGNGTALATTFPAAVIFKRSVNRGAVFANLSGCTNAFIEIQ